MLRQNNTFGILCLVAGIAIFSVQDLILKLLSGTYPLPQAMVLRSLTALPFLLLITRVFDGNLRTIASAGWPRMVARGLLLFLSYTSYYLALAALPIATTVALYFTAPLMITILSVVMLGEAVNWRRWLAVVAGFAGVVILVRPGSDLFDWAALMPVFCGLTYGLSMVLARRMGETDTAAAMAFWGNIVFLTSALFLSVIFGTGRFEGQSHPSLQFLTRGWVWPTVLDTALMCLCGLIAAMGLTLLTQAYRVAQSSTVAPFEYTSIFWGVLWGWYFWSDLPDSTGWLGIAIIIGAGLYILHRERVVATAQSGKP